MSISSMKCDGRPSWQFYPDDWIAETSLRVCDLAARGLWIELLCHMFRSSERGILLLNGKQMGSKHVADLVGRSEAEVKQALDQLLANGVCSTREDGAIYSRRMVRDESIRRSKAEAGHVGGLASARSRRRSKREAKGGSSTPSSTSSSVSSPTSTATKEQRKQTCSEPGTAPVPELSVPPVLVGLELYETDKKLLKAWPKLEPALLKANPGVDLPDQIAKAHAWEMANPQRRKRDRPRFLANWLARAQDKLEQPQRFESFAARDKRERDETGKQLEEALERERLEMEEKEQNATKGL